MFTEAQATRLVSGFREATRNLATKTDLKVALSDQLNRITWRIVGLIGLGLAVARWLF